MPALPEILALALFNEVPLPGTQPNELALPPEPSSTCACHDFPADAISSPGASYKATIMALSARDPLFRAALQVSYVDRPELTDLCLRCHAPAAWLQGRSEPADGSLLQPEDLESVTCDICHRAVPADPPLVGDGQLTISTNTAKRARRGAAPMGDGHRVVADTYVGSSELCGVCHSLFNPAENAHDATGRDLGVVYYEQRTFEEWADSAYPGRNIGCIECHMTKTSGAAVRGGAVYDDLSVHNFVGGNLFAVQAVQFLNPNLAISGLVPEVRKWVTEQLAKAAELEITGTDPGTLSVESGEPFSVSVRLTNKTGHKLPSGYPEGRRVYLEVSMTLDGRPPEILSGAWDRMSGKIVRDPQIRTYETEHGRIENGISARTRHLILMNQILSDTRIPPEGFAPRAPDMLPAGRDYGSSAPYRHFDEHSYTFIAPEVTGTVTGTITVRAMYQETDGDVVAFLVNQTQGKPESDNLSRAWEALGHAPPREMVRASIPVTFTEKAMIPPDAGVAIDSGGGFKIEDGGCACATSVPVTEDFTWLWLAALALALHRSRSRSRHHGIQASRTPLPRGRSGTAHLR